MIKAHAIIDNNNNTVYKVGDKIYSSIEEIFNGGEYLSLDPVKKSDLISDIRNMILDFLYEDGRDISIFEVSNAFDEYIETLGDDVIYIYFTNVDMTYIYDRNEDTIKAAISDILEKYLEE